MARISGAGVEGVRMAVRSICAWRSVVVVMKSASCRRSFDVSFIVFSVVIQCFELRRSLALEAMRRILV